MANPNAPFGFRPVRHQTGGTIRPSEQYKIANALASNIAVGDPVAKTGTDMNIQLGVDGVAGASWIGIFAGCKYRDAKGNIVYSPIWASGQTTFNAEGAQAYVYDDPNIVFAVRASAALNATDLGQFAGTVATAPNTTLGQSRMALNSADITATLDNMKIVSLLPVVGNDFGSFAQAEVLISFHELRSAAYLAS
jgi:hypothetical protein